MAMQSFHQWGLIKEDGLQAFMEVKVCGAGALLCAIIATVVATVAIVMYIPASVAYQLLQSSCHH